MINYIIIGGVRAVWELFKLYMWIITLLGFIVAFFYGWALTFGVLDEFLELVLGIEPLK